MDHEKFQGQDNVIPHQQSSASPPLSSGHDLKIPHECYSMETTLSVYQDHEDPQEPYSVHTMHHQLKDLQNPPLVEIHSCLHEVCKTVEDSTERVG